MHWNKGHYEEFYKKYNVTVIGSLDDFSIKNFLRTLREWKKVRSTLIRYQIHIFHIMYADPNSLWCVFREKNTLGKWILTTRGTDILKGIPGHYNKKDLLNKIVSALYTKAFKKFDWITCTSQQQKKGVKKIVDHKNVEIIRTGVDVINVLKDTIKYRNPLLADRKYILFPRNMRPLYNHEFSLAAIRLLPEQIKKEYLFVFVDRDGSDHAYVSKVEDLMKQDKNAQFIFMNRQSQEAIWQLYKDASLVIMNPISDGAPVSAMEAMLCQSPLIIGNLEYDKDIFENTVLKLCSWEPQELASIIINVLSGSIVLDKVAASSRIVGIGNRATEMKKLRDIYLSLSPISKTFC